MKKAFSILLACLLVISLGAIHAFAAQSGSSTQLQGLSTNQIRESLAQASDSTRYSIANMILGDSDYLIIQSPSVSVKVAKKAHPELNWTFDEMELENGRYVNEIQAVDKNGVVQKVKVDAITSEIVSDTLAGSGAQSAASGASTQSASAAQDASAQTAQAAT